MIKTTFSIVIDLGPRKDKRDLIDRSLGIPPSCTTMEPKALEADWN